MYGAVYVHEIIIYIMLALFATCSLCVCFTLGIDTYQRRRRRQQQLGDFPEYNEQDFQGPDLARQDSIKARVSHLEKIKKAAKTQLDIEDGKECIICYNEFVKDDDLVQLECSQFHVYHLECIKQWLQTGKRECPTCRTEISMLQ